MKLIALVCALLFAWVAAAKWHKPEYCGKFECPPFDVDEERDTYDIRTYDEGWWVLTNVTDSKYEIAYTKASARLLKYFKGHNRRHRHSRRSNDDALSLKGLDMPYTTPLLAYVPLTKDAQQTEQEYVFSMWLDPEEWDESRSRAVSRHRHDDEPPKPKSKDVWVEKFPETTVFVRAFGGFATESTILQESQALHETLMHDNEENFDNTHVFVAVYDPAIKLLNRHNEIHVVEKQKKDDTDSDSDVAAFWR